MQLRPVDLQLSLTKSVEVNKEQLIQQQRQSHLQQSQHQTFEMAMKHQSEMVVAPKKIDSSTISNDSNEGKNPAYYKQKARQKKLTQQNDEEETPDSHNIDIKI